jgi:hypothetical protein
MTTLYTIIKIFNENKSENDPNWIQQEQLAINIGSLRLSIQVNFKAMDEEGDQVVGMKSPMPS